MIFQRLGIGKIRYRDVIWCVVLAQRFGRCALTNRHYRPSTLVYRPMQAQGKYRDRMVIARDREERMIASLVDKAIEGIG